jgi:hypothetical protein
VGIFVYAGEFFPLKFEVNGKPESRSGTIPSKLVWAMP